MICLSSEKYICKTDEIEKDEDNLPQETHQISNKSFTSNLFDKLTTDAVNTVISKRNLMSIMQAVVENDDKSVETFDLAYLVESINFIWSKLNLEVKKQKFTKKDLFIWAIFEVIETEVDGDDLIEWLNHEATIFEIIRSSEKTSMYSLLKFSPKKAWSRYQKLLNNKN